MIQFRGYLQTHFVTESYVKGVIKNLFESTPRRKGEEKNANNANDRINITNID